MACPSKLGVGWWGGVGPIISISLAFCPPTTWPRKAPGLTGNRDPKRVKTIRSTGSENIGNLYLFQFLLFCETCDPLEKFDLKFVTVLTDFLRPNLTQFWWELFLENTSERPLGWIDTDFTLQLLLSRPEKIWACIDRDYTPPCVLLGYFDTQKGRGDIG